MRSTSSLALRNTASAGRDERTEPGVQVGVGELVLVEVEHVDERLGRQQAQPRREGEVDPGGLAPRHTACSPPRAPSGPRAAFSRSGLDSFLIRDSFSSRDDRLLEGLQVGEDQLGVDRLDVRARRDLAVDVDDVAVLEGAHDLADRVGLTDVGEELVAQPLPLGRAAHDAGDVDEGDRRRQDLLAPEDLGEAARAARPAAGRRRRWGRWSRTGSSRRGRCSWSGR